MKMTAIERGTVSPASYLRHLCPRELTRLARDEVGSLRALAIELDVTESAPGNWLHGRNRPSRRYIERMGEIVGGGV